VPFARLLASTQLGVPELQSIAPVLHSFGLVVHAAPAEHATQLPVLQTPPGQDVPVPTFPFSMHTAVPELQLIAPVRQTLPGVHAAPAEQGLHAPALHTPPGQLVPFALLLLFTQTPLPELQSIDPL